MAPYVFIVLIIFGVALLWRLGDTSHGRASKRLLVLAFAILVILTILLPETTTAIANLIGIGRGSDLVFYLTAIGLMFLAAITYLSTRRLEVRIAQMVSTQAVAEALDRSPNTGFGQTTADEERVVEGTSTQDRDH